MSLTNCAKFRSALLVALAKQEALSDGVAEIQDELLRKRKETTERRLGNHTPLLHHGMEQSSLGCSRQICWLIVFPQIRNGVRFLSSLVLLILRKTTIQRSSCVSPEPEYGLRTGKTL
jgi:hypothetical protein